jgi:ketosteroid isomerase-like protein
MESQGGVVMKRGPRSSNAAARRRVHLNPLSAFGLSLLVLGLAALGLSACGGSGSSATASTPAKPLVTAAPSPAATPSAASASAAVARTEAVVKALMATWNGAWSATRDRAGLASLYADDVQYYDAALVDTVISKSDIDAMGQDPEWWKTFQVSLRSSFVSWDGRFAATLGRFALRDKSGKLPWQPGASVLAIRNDKIAWEYDYYGGEQGTATQTEPMLGMPTESVSQGSTTDQSAVDTATATVEKWLAAYNGRDAKTFLSFYSKDAKRVDVVSPKWRVMTKSQLAADIAAQFLRAGFASKLEPSPGSAMGSAFFVSGDGRYAAVQGSYRDARTGGARPMLIVLELDAGAIVRQYDFVALDRSVLQP